jgi:hypothetical protein
MLNKGFFIIHVQYKYEFNLELDKKKKVALHFEGVFFFTQIFCIINKVMRDVLVFFIFMFEYLN